MAVRAIGPIRQNESRPALPYVPEADGSVLAGRRQRLSVRRKRAVVDLAEMAAKWRASEMGCPPQVMPGEIAEIVLARCGKMVREPLDCFGGPIGLEQLARLLDISDIGLPACGAGDPGLPGSAARSHDAPSSDEDGHGRREDKEARGRDQCGHRRIAPAPSHGTFDTA